MSSLICDLFTLIYFLFLYFLHLARGIRIASFSPVHFQHVFSDLWGSSVIFLDFLPFIIAFQALPFLWQVRTLILDWLIKKNLVKHILAKEHKGKLQICWLQLYKSGNSCVLFVFLFLHIRKKFKHFLSAQPLGLVYVRIWLMLSFIEQTIKLSMMLIHFVFLK